MLSKSSFFTTILLLLPALASAQTADDDLQLELRYYAPKLKFTSHGIVPAAYSNFRDTLNIKNGNAPEYRLSGKNWYVDYIAIHEKGYASHHIPAHGSLIPADSRTKLNLDYASFNYLSPIKTIMTTRQTGGLTTGYKPLILASASRRWLSLCSSHIALFSFAAPVRGVLNTSYP